MVYHVVQSSLRICSFGIGSVPVHEFRTHMLFCVLGMHLLPTFQFYVVCVSLCLQSGSMLSRDRDALPWPICCSISASCEDPSWRNGQQVSVEQGKAWCSKDRRKQPKCPTLPNLKREVPWHAWSCHWCGHSDLSGSSTTPCRTFAFTFALLQAPFWSCRWQMTQHKVSANRAFPSPAFVNLLLFILVAWFAAMQSVMLGICNSRHCLWSTFGLSKQCGEVSWNALEQDSTIECSPSKKQQWSRWTLHPPK